MLIFDDRARGWRIFCLCNPRNLVPSVLASFLAFASPAMSEAQIHSGGGLQASEREKVIIDTDIGLDIDDAFAVALALRSPQLDILGFSTASGDTAARAKIIDRMLGESGYENIPVAAGIPTSAPNGSLLPEGIIGPQRRYGENGHYARASHPPAVNFILEQIHRFPGQVTLVTIGPLSNVGALMDRDMGTFRKLKRVVMVGGWIGPADLGLGQVGPGPEHNVSMDIRSSQKLFTSGIPIYVIPFDSTINLTLDEVRRQAVFSAATPLTDALTLLYNLFGGGTPVLFDAMAVAFVVDPQLCPVEPVHIIVDEKGITQVDTGQPNARICLHSDREGFLDYYMQRIIDIHRSTQ